MNITNENALQILNALAEINPEFSAVVDALVQRIENNNASESRKRELLQLDRNLRDDIKDTERLIAQIDKKLCEINSLKGQRLSACKRLIDLKRQREAVYKEWIAKYSRHA